MTESQRAKIYIGDAEIVLDEETTRQLLEAVQHGTVAMTSLSARLARKVEGIPWRDIGFALGCAFTFAAIAANTNSEIDVATREHLDDLNRWFFAEAPPELLAKLKERGLTNESLTVEALEDAFQKWEESGGAASDN